MQLGTLFTVAEAQKIGLVDLVVPDFQTGVNVAEKKMQEFLQVPSMYSVLFVNFIVVSLKKCLQVLLDTCRKC